MTSVIHADGTRTVHIEQGPLDPNWMPGMMADERIPQRTPAQGDLGQDKEAQSSLFWDAANLRYGSYSNGSPSDGRCPTSWPSNQWCGVPVTKAFSWVSTLGHAYDFEARVNEQQVWDDTLDWFDSYWGGGSLEFKTRAPGPFNAEIKQGYAPVDCLGYSDSLACTRTYFAGTFTWNGLKFRQSVGYPDPSIVATIYVDSVNLGDYLAHHVSGPIAQQLRDNFTGNMYLHELGHAMGNAHNPASPVMGQVPSNEDSSVPHELYTSDEWAGRAFYHP